MPFNIRRSAQFYDKEVLKFPQLGLIAKSVVLDATAFVMNTDPDGRTVVEAGTILKLSATNASRYVQFDGTGSVKGVLTRQVELLARSTAGNEAAAMFFHEAVFATTQIVGFTQYASAVVSSLPTCKFE
jgi:hypothetical protein